MGNTNFKAFPEDLCSNFHPVHHQVTAFNFYMAVSVNPPTLQSYKIIHIYVTHSYCYQSYVNHSSSLSTLGGCQSVIRAESL